MDWSDSDASASKKKFKCTTPNCCAVFSRNDKLLVHIRKHTGERPFICDEEGCDKTYTNNSHLRRHKRVTHGEKITQNIACSHQGCDLIFANKYSLKKHYNRKHNFEPYPYKCKECEQGFHRKKHLVQHVYIHTGVAAYSCDKCDMSFTTSYTLNKHKREHRVYNCECGEVFHRWSLLLTHRKSCKKPRFTCEICAKPFSHLGNFESHKLSHKNVSERRVFVCPFSQCKRFYFYKKNLKIHINMFHKKNNEGKIFKCTYPNCKVVLKTKVLQKRHLQRHFEWRKKRQIRSDAGKPKKPVAATLISENFVEEIVEDINETTSNAGHVTDQDDNLLAKCDLVLKLLLEKVVTAK